MDQLTRAFRNSLILLEYVAEPRQLHKLKQLPIQLIHHFLLVIIGREVIEGFFVHLIVFEIATIFVKHALAGLPLTINKAAEQLVLDTARQMRCLVGDYFPVVGYLQVVFLFLVKSICRLHLDRLLLIFVFLAPINYFTL